MFGRNGGGEVDGHRFMVAAILGPPALWAPAREAARFGMGRKAIRSARLALGRAFSGRLRYILDGGQRVKAEALIFMCPLTSKVLSEDDDTLEAAGVDVNNAAEAIRLGFHALTGDWRTAPNVDVERCRIARDSSLVSSVRSSSWVPRPRRAGFVPLTVPPPPGARTPPGRR